MKNLILSIFMIFIMNTIQCQNDNWIPKVPEKEFMFLESHWDYSKTMPGDKDSKDYGIHYAFEFGMRSYIPNFIGVEAKIAYENFPELYGGFESFGGGFGTFLVVGANEQIMYYVGFRAAKVYRTSPEGSKDWAVNPGLELKFTYTFNEKFYIGARYLLDKAYDQKIMNWDPSTRWAAQFTLGWNIKTIGAYKN